MNLDKFLGSIYGAVIGDALGGPFETMTSDEIRNTVGKVEQAFYAPSTNAHLREDNFRKNVQKGAISDDTITLRAVMRGITRGYLLGEAEFADIMDTIADEHKYAFISGGERGWGRSSRRACQALLDDKHWSSSGTPDGAGNGVMMKIAPYGLLRSMAPKDVVDFRDECATLAKMTHLGTPAIVGGAVHAFVITSLALNIRDPFVLLPCMYKLAIDLESNLEFWKDSISEQIKIVMKYLEYGVEGQIKDEQTPGCISSLFFGGTSYAPSSFGTCYAIFFKHCLNVDNPDPFKAVLDAVSAGGDTDTNASIVGSLVGALHGMKAIPKELVEQVEFSEEIDREIREFYSVCESLAETREASKTERSDRNDFDYQV